MRQQTFFDAPPSPPHSGSATSREAADKIAGSAESLRRQVLQYIASRSDGATDNEVQSALGMQGNTQRPRRQELQRACAIEDSGTTRLTETNRKAIVWQVTSYGRSVLEK